MAYNFSQYNLQVTTNEKNLYDFGNLQYFCHDKDLVEFSVKMRC